MCDNTILPHLISKNRLTELGMRLFVAEIGERLIFACGENILQRKTFQTSISYDIN